MERGGDREVRGVLLEEIEQHRVELKLAEDELDDLLRASGDGSGDDQADAGAKTAEREHEISVAANARASLRQAEHALEQLDAGTYGICENCGNPIGKLRLQARPRATLCMTCQGEAGSPLTPDHATSTPRAGVDGVSTTRTDTTDATTGTVSSRTAEDHHPRPDRRKRLFVVLGVVAVLAYLTDQLSKIVALDVLADGEPRPFVGSSSASSSSATRGRPVARCQQHVGHDGNRARGSRGDHRRGAPAGIPSLGGRARSAARCRHRQPHDRFVRPPGGGQGHVVDFIDYNRWFIGNVADIWIVSAAGLIIILALLGIGVDGRRDHGRGASAVATHDEDQPRANHDTTDQTDDKEGNRA